MSSSTTASTTTELTAVPEASSTARLCSSCLTKRLLSPGSHPPKPTEGSLAAQEASTQQKTQLEQLKLPTGSTKRGILHS